MLHKYAARKTTCLSISSARPGSRLFERLPKLPPVKSDQNEEIIAISNSTNLSAIVNLKQPSKSGRVTDVVIPISDLDDMTIVRKNHVDRADLVFPNLPGLNTTTQPELSGLLSQKLEICSQICDFYSEKIDHEAKIIKSNTLSEILTYVTDIKLMNELTSEDYSNILKMISANIFRKFQPVTEAVLNYNDEPRIVDNSLPHLLKVYLILHKIIETKPFYVADMYIKILNNFNSPDLTERETVSKILVTLYTQCPKFRTDLLKKVTFLLFDYRFLNTPPFCVWPSLLFLFEILKIEQNILNDRIQKIFWEAVVPLITTRHLNTFGPYIVAICNLMIANSSSIAKRLLPILLQQFPIMSSNKMIWFVEYLLVITEKISSSDFQRNAVQIFRMLGRCAMCMNAKVTEASFQIWFNPKMAPRLLDVAKNVFPIIHGSIVRASRDHWNSTIQNKALSVLKTMRELNPFLYDDLNCQRMQTSREPVPAKSTQKQWALIARMAAREDREVDLREVLGQIQLRFNDFQPLASITSSGNSPLPKPKIMNPIKKNGNQWR